MEVITGIGYVERRATSRSPTVLITPQQTAPPHEGSSAGDSVKGASGPPSAAGRKGLPIQELILNALCRFPRTVGLIFGCAAALSTNGALLLGFETLARRVELGGDGGNTATQLASKRATSAAPQMKAIRMVELPPVVIVGRRLTPATDLTRPKEAPQVAARPEPVVPDRAYAVATPATVARR